jgi:hypothetical protein
LDFTAIGGKRQGREVPQSLRVKSGAKHPVWKTQWIRMLPNRIGARQLQAPKPRFYFEAGPYPAIRPCLMFRQRLRWARKYKMIYPEPTASF